MFPKYSIGVSISGTNAFVVCLRKKMSRIQIHAQDLVDFHASVKLDSRLKLLDSYLSDFVDANKIPNPDLFIGFSRDHTILRMIDLPAAVKENLRSSIGYSIEKYLPLGKDDIYYDCTLVYEDRESRKLQVMLGAAKKADMLPYVDFSVSLENGVSGVLFEPLAVVNFIEYHARRMFEENDNVFVFYSDGACMDATLVRNRRVASSRSLKVQDSVEIPSAVSEEISRHRRPGSEGAFRACAVFCGSGFSTAMVDTMDLDPAVIVKKELMTHPRLSSADYLPAAGLAMSGMELGTPCQINFLPEQKRRKVSKAAIHMLFSLTAAAVVLAVIWVGSFITNQKLIQTRLDGQLERLSDKVVLINQKKDQIAALESKINEVNAIIETEVSVNEILEELSLHIPETVWLSGLTYTRGKGMKINGYSDLAADIIPIIEDSDLFENGAFLSAITKTKDKKEKFVIGFDIVGQTD